MIFIFVGRLVGDKGINELIAAFRKFPQDQRKLNFAGWFVETELDPLEQKQ
jgi:glycosyltransferase involved in cell wall biosynthesis